MSQDVVQRLRDSVRACRALDRSSLLTEAADEIEKLRSLVRFQDRVIRSGDVACLTGAEKASLDEAIEEFRERGNLVSDQIAENLHRLTERLK